MIEQATNAKEIEMSKKIASDTKYIVTLQGDAISSHRSERAAISAAKKLCPTARVTMAVASGTYSSTTRVYPTRGNTYTAQA